MDRGEQYGAEYVVAYSTTLVKKIGLFFLAILTIGFPLMFLLLETVWRTSYVADRAGNVWFQPRFLVAPVVALFVCNAIMLVVWALKLLPRTHPVIVLKADGMSIHTWNYDIDLLRWEEIEAVTLVASIVRFGDSVGIVPKDPNAFARQLKLVQRWYFQSKANFCDECNAGGRLESAIWIPVMYTSISAKELIEHIHDFQLRYHPGGAIDRNGAPI